MLHTEGAWQRWQQQNDDDEHHVQKTNPPTHTANSALVDIKYHHLYKYCGAVSYQHVLHDACTRRD